jgi:predicted outer membrane repeat protein
LKRKRFKQTAALVTAAAALVNLACPAWARSNVTYTYTDAQNNTRTDWAGRDIEVLNDAVALAEDQYQESGHIYTVTLTASEVVERTVEIHDSVTLDLNGCTVSLDTTKDDETSATSAQDAATETPVIAICAHAPDESKTTTASEGDTKVITITSSATDEDGNIANGTVTHKSGTGSGILVDLSNASGDANAPSYEVTIEHVTVEGNTAETGGGIAIIGQNAESADPSEPTASADPAESTDPSEPTASADSADPTEPVDRVTIDQCVVENNKATQNGGGVAVQGDVDVQITSSTIESNTASQNGGGVAVQGDAEVQIKSSAIESNRSSCTGGGIYSADSDVTLVDTTVSDNITWSAGGGIAIEGGSLTLLDDQSTTCVANNSTTLNGALGGKGDDLYLAPSAADGTAATVILNEANGTLYPTILDIEYTDWYVDGMLNGDATPRWMEKDEVDGTYYFQTYPVPNSDNSEDPENTDQIGQTGQKPGIGKAIQITAPTALKAGYDALKLEGGNGSTNTLPAEPGSGTSQTHSGTAGGSLSDFWDDQSTSSRLITLEGSGLGVVRQEMPTRPYGPILRPKTPGSGNTGASVIHTGTNTGVATGTNSIRPTGTATTAQAGTRHKAARTGDDLPFAAGVFTLCALGLGLLRKKRPHYVARHAALPHR